MAVKFYKKEHQVPLEMHKVRIVQKLFLPPVEKRVEYINEAGNNTFLLQNKDVFMDMLTDSGVNALSQQLGFNVLVPSQTAASEEYGEFRLNVSIKVYAEQVTNTNPGETS